MEKKVKAVHARKASISSAPDTGLEICLSFVKRKKKILFSTVLCVAAVTAARRRDVRRTSLWRRAYTALGELGCLEILLYYKNERSKEMFLKYNAPLSWFQMWYRVREGTWVCDTESLLVQGQLEAGLKMDIFIAWGETVFSIIHNLF